MLKRTLLPLLLLMLVSILSNLTAARSSSSFSMGITTISVPVISYPKSGDIVYSLSPSLNWYFTTAANDFVSIELQYSTDPNFGASGTITVTDISASARTQKVSGLTAGSKYYWRLRAKAANNTYSAYSKVENFVVNEALGALAPTPTWPVKNPDIYDNSPVLYWYSNSSASSIKFNVKYGTDASLTTFTEIQNIDKLSQALPKLSPGKWYWQVNSVVDGNSSDYSPIQEFTIVAPGNNVVVPKPSWPIGGAIVYTNTPTLNWYTENSAIGLKFSVKYSTDPLIKSEVKTIDEIKSLSVVLPELESGTTYYWQVMSTDGTTSSNYSPVQRFKVNGGVVTSSPEVPVPAWPIGKATVYSASQKLSWYLLSGSSNVSSYTVIWGEYGNLNNQIPNIKDKYVEISGLLPGHHYAWQVLSVDKQGNKSNACKIQEFFTSGGSGNKPYTPEQAWPTGGAVVYTTSPVISWYTLEASFGITEYKVKYSTNPDMSDATETTQSGSKNSIQLSGLVKGTTYFWQVQAYDGNVYSDPQTPPAKFTVYAEKEPVTPLVQSPVGGVGIGSNTVELSWALGTKSEDLSYNLQYSTKPDFSNPVELKDLNSTSIEINNLQNTSYYWRVSSKTSDGSVSTYSPVGEFSVKSTTGIAEKTSTVDKFALLQNYPNPFNPSTLIQFNLPVDCFVTVEVFNTIGRSVGQIFNGEKAKGFSSIQFNASNLPSGIYFYKMTARDLNGKMNFFDVKKMMLVK